MTWVGNHYGEESDGSVTIRESGIYGLYNIVTFQCPQQQHNTTIEQHDVLHRIHIERSSDDKNASSSNFILEKSVILKSEWQSFNSSELFEFVSLHEGDRVFPTLSNSDFIYKLKQASIWGIFQITGQKF